MGLNGWEWVIIAVLAFLLFGPKRLPELAKSFGQSIRSFKKALNEPEEQPAADENKPSETK